LRGIAVALEQHAPHLAPVIYELIRAGRTEPSSGQIGQSIYGKLTGTISWEQAEPILTALRSIECDYGHQTQFAGRQINFLVLSWRRFAEPKELPPSK